jgi:hypothetical protein
MNNVQQIISLIHKVQSNDELNQILDAWKLKRTYLTRQNVRQLAVGDKVQWEGRNGFSKGTVTKINRKYIIVDTGFGKWRVPANMLEKV